MDTRQWNFTHNNEPVAVLDVPESVTSEAQVIRLGLQHVGRPDSPHPCRAWPAPNPPEERPS